jgi:hypothetical protein
MNKEVIYIAKGERVFLPSKYRPINNLCAVIYDHLTELYKLELYKPFQHTEVKMDDQGQKSDLDTGNLHILDYLKITGHHDELTDILVKNVTLAVVSDLVHFVFESISCAKRGKMTVAYALLRKPFKDELLLLESILDNPHEFVNRFFHDGNPASYDPSTLNEEQKRAIIEAAVGKVRPNAFSTDMLFDYRYDKLSPVGISSFSDHALHIVTRNKKYPTSEQNLNFVFSNTDDIKFYWKHYYTIVPYLLLYTASVVDGIVFNSLKGKNEELHRDFKIFKRFLGIILYANKPYRKKRNGKYSNLGFDFKLNCEKCGFETKLDISDYELFFYSDVVICQKCFHAAGFEPGMFNDFISQL